MCKRDQRLNREDSKRKIGNRCPRQQERIRSFNASQNRRSQHPQNHKKYAAPPKLGRVLNCRLWHWNQHLRKNAYCQTNNSIKRYTHNFLLTYVEGEVSTSRVAPTLFSLEVFGACAEWHRQVALQLHRRWVSSVHQFWPWFRLWLRDTRLWWSADGNGDSRKIWAPKNRTVNGITERSSHFGGSWPKGGRGRGTVCHDIFWHFLGPFRFVHPLCPHRSERRRVLTARVSGSCLVPCHACRASHPRRWQLHDRSCYLFCVRCLSSSCKTSVGVEKAGSMDPRWHATTAKGRKSSPQWPLGLSRQMQQQHTADAAAPVLEVALATPAPGSEKLFPQASWGDTNKQHLASLCVQFLQPATSHWPTWARDWLDSIARP